MAISEYSDLQITISGEYIISLIILPLALSALNVRKGGEVLQLS
jgi:hypothetical protein